jgi:hypothetical protein
MTKNPIYNALAAFGYIVLIVFGMYNISNIDDVINEFIMTAIMLSLLTLSVAVMAYIFGYQPLVLFLDNKKKEAVSLFLKTVGAFSVLTAILISVYLLIIL